MKERKSVFLLYARNSCKSHVGKCIEAIDQTRLNIAYYLGLPVLDIPFPREERWKEIMNHIRKAQLEENTNNIADLRNLRLDYLSEISTAVFQHNIG